jgi:iron complex transport system ATP-binding protein
VSGLVAFDAVTVRFGDSVVVDDVTFSVDAGEWFGVLGPNGAGKSTLLRTLVGGPIASGSASIHGSDMTTTAGRARAELVAYVPQRPQYPPGMAVFDFVLLGRTPHLGFLAAERSDDIAAVWAALDALDLVSFAERDVASLSGGETQRASMARVIAQESPVLVLDEATAALDVARQHQVLELIDTVRVERGIAIVSAMHDLTAAAQFCDRVGVMDAGRLRGVGVPKDVMTEELLCDVFEPTVRVIDVEGEQVIVSMREKEPR